MKKFSISFIFLVLLHLTVAAQPGGKLVISIVVDQMRWEYLNRFKSNFSPHGFVELMNNGYSCLNTHINYFPTFDAPGYASLYTGTVPSMHGIPADNWYDVNTRRLVYSVEDQTVNSVGAKSFGVSPVQLQATTIGDELKLFSKLKSKVFSIAMRDRGAVLSGGFSANAAYWYDSKSGNFISSTYYLVELPDWVRKFNSDSLVDKLYNTNWTLLYPKETYTNTGSEDMAYKGKPFGNDQSKFPYDLSRFKYKDYGKINSTPFGNTLLFEFAKRLIKSEKLGTSLNTDLLLISLSSNDYIGHSFPSNSLELEDAYLRLDLELSKFISFLDNNFGRKNYLLVLTSNHGVANSVGYLKENRILSGTFSMQNVIRDVELKLKAQFGDYNWIKTSVNTMLYLNDSSIIESKIDKTLLINQIQKLIENYNGVQKVIDLNNITNNLLEINFRNKIVNGIYSKLAGDLLILLKPNYYDFGNIGTTHGSPYSYDTHIPLLWYGNRIKSEKDYSDISITDIAPTLSAILGIPEPNAATGKIIQQLLFNINQNKNEP